MSSQQRRPTQRPRDQQTTEISLNRPNTFTKIDLKPKRYHYYSVVLFIFGTLFPPLAVAARFGIGSDFWLNLLLTICGYIPGHGHNFYIQNIRNNKNNNRTPKWARQYGLVDDSEIRRKERRSQWAGRYNDRLPNSTLEGQEVEEGQIPDRPGLSREASEANGADRDPALWSSREDEQFYGQRRNQSGSVSTGSGGGRWRYPANFEGTEFEDDGGGKSKGGLLGRKSKKKKDRWALSEDARKGARVPDGEFVGRSAEAEERDKKKKSKKKKGKKGDDDLYVSGSRATSRSEIEEPEDAVGGLYGDRRAAAAQTPDASERRERDDRELFEHQF